MFNDYQKKAEDFLAKHDATIDIQFREVVKNPWGTYTGNHNAYDVTIERNGESFTIDFKDSAHSYNTGGEPSAYDILACLTTYDVGTYKDFCAEFGYDGGEDTFDIYNAVVEEYNNVERLFGDCMEELWEIQ